MTEDNTEWGLVEPFDIDNGELQGLSHQLCFCMGAEFMMVRDALDANGPISRTIMTPNAGRIKRMCIRRKRKFNIEPVPDMEDQWQFLEIAGIDGEFRLYM